MRASLFWPIALAVLLVSLAGCDHTRQQIVGKWKVVGDTGSAVWEFESNGRAVVDGTPGRYTLGDNSRIKIQIPSATFVYQLEISGDHMTWRSPNGSRTELVRQK